jgi:homocysteine S-methyltransferase
MNLDELLIAETHILAEGSIYELLRRNPEVVFDDHIAHAGLIYDVKSAQVLEQVMRSYIDVGVSLHRPVVFTTATWRANRDRIHSSAFSDRAVNEDNAQFCLSIRDSYANTGLPILLSGNTGPKGDAYKPDESPDLDESRSFHSFQIEALASGGVDFLQASTIPALPEALGIALEMSDTGLPYVISFIVNKFGQLLDGTLLRDAIYHIDDHVGDAPARYAVNCVHPTVLNLALDNNAGIESRIIGFNGNTSTRSVDELDGLEELDTEDPEAFALANKQLIDKHGIRIVGGCCGTNPAHISAIANIIFPN